MYVLYLRKFIKLMFSVCSGLLTSYNDYQKGRASKKTNSIVPLIIHYNFQRDFESWVFFQILFLSIKYQEPYANSKPFGHNVKRNKFGKLRACYQNRNRNVIFNLSVGITFDHLELS